MQLPCHLEENRVSVGECVCRAVAWNYGLLYTVGAPAPFIHKYSVPGGRLPIASEGLYVKMKPEDLHYFSFVLKCCIFLY